MSRMPLAIWTSPSSPYALENDDTTLQHNRTNLQYDGRALGYDGVTSNLILKGHVKGHVIMSMRRSVVLKGRTDVRKGRTVVLNLKVCLLNCVP